MKATFELPDDLMVAAKKRAAELKTPVRALVEAGLRAQLKQASKKKRVAVKWVTTKGELLIDISSRETMHGALDNEK